jgi:hypothetical protein
MEHMRSIALFLVMVTSLYGQAYYEDGMTWKQSTIELDRISILNQSWVVHGDTFIDGYLYKTIDLDYEALLIDPKFDTVSIRQSGSRRGERLVRQEGKKVFQRTGDFEERLLYDFDLDKGDTAFFDFNARNSGLIVDSIGRYYNGADTLNVFFMDDRRFRLYEGVGWQSGIFNEPSAPLSRRQNVLHCFKHRGFINSWEDEWEWLYWYYPDIKICDIILSISNDQKLSLNVVPNPSIGPIEVWVEQNSTYAVHSLNGVLVKRGQLRSGANKIELSPGVYVISAINSGGRVTQRVLIE